MTPAATRASTDDACASRKPTPRTVKLVHQTYQPSKAELEADARIKGVTFKQAIAALVRPVRIRRVWPKPRPSAK